MIASNLAALGLQDSNKRLVQTLEVNSEVLDNIHEEFKNMLGTSIKIHSFQEAKGISGMRAYIIRYESALDCCAYLCLLFYACVIRRLICFLGG